MPVVEEVAAAEAVPVACSATAGEAGAGATGDAGADGTAGATGTAGSTTVRPGPLASAGIRITQPG